MKVIAGPHYQLKTHAFTRIIFRICSTPCARMLTGTILPRTVEKALNSPDTPAVIHIPTTAFAAGGDFAAAVNEQGRVKVDKNMRCVAAQHICRWFPFGLVVPWDYLPQKGPHPPRTCRHRVWLWLAYGCSWSRALGQSWPICLWSV